MPDRDPCETILELLTTMHVLRSPGGCPWDAEQTPESLAPYLIEEACETIEAIETGFPEKVVDELGDLLLQIIFQAEIFSERGQFDFADVAAGINAKLLRRHPHVFAASENGATTEELARQWERIKREEQSDCHHIPHPLGQTPSRLPALQRAQKIFARARRAGLDDNQLFSPLPEGRIMTGDELGRALLSLVIQAELSDLDAEQTLRQTIRNILVETGPKLPTAVDIT